MLHIQSILADAVLIVVLQIAGVTPDLNLRLQLGGLAGAMLAVRTIDGKVSVADWFKVALSGMILANFCGFAWCEYRSIKLDTFIGWFVFFVFGFLSDIILRGVRIAGSTTVSEVPGLVKSIFQKFKSKSN